MAITYFFVDRIADFILAPALRALPAGSTFIFTRPGEGFAFNLDVALIGGLILAAPFVMYQVWRFIAPGLYSKEKKYVVPFVALSVGGNVVRRALHALPDVSGDDRVLRHVQLTHHQIHAADRGHVRSLQEHDDRDGPGLSDADAGLLPREDAVW